MALKKTENNTGITIDPAVVPQTDPSTTPETPAVEQETSAETPVETTPETQPAPVPEKPPETSADPPAPPVVEIPETPAPAEPKVEVNPNPIPETNIPHVEPRVRIRMVRDHRCNIAMKFYDLKKGQCYDVPDNVKQVLNRAGLLAPL